MFFAHPCSFSCISYFLFSHLPPPSNLVSLLNNTNRVFKREKYHKTVDEGPTTNHSHIQASGSSTATSSGISTQASQRPSSRPPSSSNNNPSTSPRTTTPPAQPPAPARPRQWATQRATLPPTCSTCRASRARLPGCPRVSRHAASWRSSLVVSRGSWAWWSWCGMVLLVGVVVAVTRRQEVLLLPAAKGRLLLPSILLVVTMVPVVEPAVLDSSSSSSRAEYSTTGEGPLRSKRLRWSLAVVAPSVPRK